jgi:hypothetical protein
MTQLSNTFQGGTDGVAITTGNSGGASGNAFNNVIAQGSVVYDDDIIINDSITALLTSATGQTNFFEWTSSWAGASEVWVRLEGRFSDATPTNNITILNFRESNETTVGCDVRLTPSGTIQLRAPLTARYTSTTVLTDNQPFRLEVHVVSSATVGHIEARLFVGANVNGTTPDDPFGSPSDNWDTGDGTVGGIAVGITSDPGASGEAMTIDSIAISDVGWLGPSSSPPPADLTMYVGVLNRLGTPPPVPTSGFGVGAFGTAPFGQ